MKIKLCFTLALLAVFATSKAQDLPFDLHFEFQAYPAGLIPGLRAEQGFGGKNAAHLRLGLNLMDHRDLGKHDDETGTGWGFTLGYKRYFREGYRGPFVGARSDVWFNEMDWMDNDGPRTGTTKITVLQPTAETGWLLPLGEKFHFTPSVAFGYEVNVKTEGEPTGEGAIFLLGISLGYRFL